MQISLTRFRSQLNVGFTNTSGLYCSAPSYLPLSHTNGLPESGAQIKCENEVQPTANCSPLDEWNFLHNVRCQSATMQVSITPVHAHTLPIEEQHVPCIISTVDKQDQQNNAILLKPAALKFKQSRKNRRRKLRHVRPLHALLCKVFLGEQLSASDFNLTSYQLSLFAEVLLRKNKSFAADM